jgi:hypothetical protein
MNLNGRKLVIKLILITICKMMLIMMLIMINIIVSCRHRYLLMGSEDVTI